jgi:hypothetical protein
MIYWQAKINFENVREMTFVARAPRKILKTEKKIKTTSEIHQKLIYLMGKLKHL